MRERQIMDEAFEQAGVQCKPILESNSIFQLAFHAMSGDLATIVPKRFAHLPNTKQKLLEAPTISQTLGLVWVHGNPVLPMTKATAALMREARDAGTFENFGLV
jgi:DNA-binding transcriptional LysR family regulator